MKGLFFGVILIVAVMAFLPGLVLADTCGNCSCEAGEDISCPGDCPATCANCIPNPLKYQSFQCLIESVINFIFLVSLALAPLMVLIGAFYLMTAGGNPARVKTAQSIFMWTAIGFFVILLAKGLIAAIKAMLGVV